MAKLVYVVDDEPNIRKLASLGLRDAGYETVEISSGPLLLNTVRRKIPDCIVLDWMMPEMDGMEVCRRLRGDDLTRPVPVIMLTARSGEIDRVLGLEMGADDYMVKPFSVKELCARVRALIRRQEYLSPGDGETLSMPPYRVRVPRRQVKKNGVVVELTLKEFDLLVILMKNAGRVLTRDVLLDKVWGVEYYGDVRTVDVHIRYLRQKLEDDDKNPQHIKTIRGIGYTFEIKEDEA